MGGLTQEGSETLAELRRGPREQYRDSPSHKAAGLVPLNLRGPLPASLLEDAAEANAPEQLPIAWEGAGGTAARSLNVVINLDHVLVGAKSLDEVGGLLQVSVSQLHHCVGDEF